MANIPVLFFGFANQEDRHLTHLRRELSEIQNQLRNKDARQKISLKKETNVSVQSILDALPFYRENLVLFHYAGHADSTELQFADQNVNAASLAAFFADYPKLKLVFLNGCSTRQQVLGFLDGGVDAVIATSVPINDLRASEFAIEFYKELNRGGTIETSYRHALKSIGLQGEFIKEPLQVDGEALEVEKLTINEGGEEKKYDLLSEPFRVRGQGLANFQEVLPWGLYHREASALHWKLEDVFPKTETLDFKLIAKLEKEKQIKKVEEELTSVDEELETLLQEDFATHKEKIQRLRLKKGRLEKRLVLANRVLDELSGGKEEKIRQAINNINYKEQIDFFAKWKNQQQVGAFLIQGSPKCGHRFLVEEVAPKQVLNFSKDRFQNFWVYFEDLNHNNSFEEEAIWKNVRMAMRLRPAGNRIVEKVAEELKAVLQKQHVILVFEGVNHLAAPSVKAFWEKLQAKLVEGHANLQMAYPNRLILLLLDKDAEVVKDAQNDNWVAGSLDKFKACFGDLMPGEMKTPPLILDPIAPISEDELWSWIFDGGLPDDIFLDDDNLAEILESSGGYVMPLIRAFCEQIGKPDLYEYYEQFDYELE